MGRDDDAARWIKMDTSAIAMRRPQFTLKTLLWLMVVVAAFFGGMAVQKSLTPTPQMPVFSRATGRQIPAPPPWGR